MVRVNYQLNGNNSFLLVKKITPKYFTQVEYEIVKEETVP